MSQQLNVEISYDELMSSYCPLWDVERALTIMLNGAKKQEKSDEVVEILDGLTAKVGRAMEPLKERIDLIEKENPKSFGK